MKRLLMISLAVLMTAVCGFVFGACGRRGDDVMAHKPIIYLYPEFEQRVQVELGNPQNITHAYPEYRNRDGNGNGVGDGASGWNVLAKPNGELTDTATGRKYYALYWEGKNTNGQNMHEGFVIKGADTVKFLEEKLAVLGLSEREANEFIIYWLPKLESNKYNYIRFQSADEINRDMPLKITPKPDTVIRVMMEFKGLENPIEVTEQEFETPNRTGFVAVEWGGTEIR